jgi:hypothetical protein
MDQDIFSSKEIHFDSENCPIDAYALDNTFNWGYRHGLKSIHAIDTPPSNSFLNSMDTHTLISNLRVRFWCGVLVRLEEGIIVRAWKRIS